MDTTISNGSPPPCEVHGQEIDSVYSDGGFIPQSDVNNHYEDDISEIDLEGYQPTYAEAFPPLPSTHVQNSAPNDTASKWRTATGPIRSTTVTQVFRVPLEERRYKKPNESAFGDDRQRDICRDIMAKTGAAIEISSGKDQGLTIMVTGKPELLAKARRMVLTQLQTQANVEISIPREHHKFILGKGGKVLQQLELQTATKITMPRDGSDIIKIVGTKEGVDSARHEIQVISDEQAKLAFERLNIEHVFHPFISGAIAASIMDQTGARINIPPQSAKKDEITIAGEKEGVAKAKETVMEIYEEKKRRTTTVSIEVKKSQHKYVIGPRGGTLQEILSMTGVSVEMPPLDSDLETITLRGEPDKLGGALTQVYEKASSVVSADVGAPRWLHRFIIGRKGQNIRKITQDLPKVHVEFSDEKDSVSLEGPPQEVEKAKESLETFIHELKASMDFAEISVDHKYHPHIIGKNGANVNRIKNETGTSILIPSNNEHSNILRIEGSPKGVASAKEEIMQMVKKLENEKTKDVLIEQRFHRAIIGTKGEKIREIRDKHPEVQISFPDAGRKSDIVNLRGPRTDVENVYTFLKKMNAELIAANYRVEVPIFKQFHKNVIGRGGTTIKKIREETDTKIELPSEGSDSDVIVITGHKAQVEAARDRITAIQNELANVTQVEVNIPHKHHNAVIGAKGRLIRSIMDDCGGVSIKFPPEGSNSDTVLIRGPKDDVEKAKMQLLEILNEKEINSFTAEIRAKPQHHRFLIGRGGANIKKVRESTGARIVFPTLSDDDKELIIIIGKKDGVEAAKQELLKAIKDLDNIVEGEVHVDPKHHKYFVAKRGEKLREIGEDFGGVVVSFPRNGVSSDRVVLKGAKDCIEGAKKRILEIVDELESMVSLECVVAQKYHRNIMGAKGVHVQKVTSEHNVQIKFPDRDPANRGQGMMNGNSSPVEENGEEPGSPPASPRKCDVITIIGSKDNAEAAKQALLDLVPVTEVLSIPYDYHRFIIGAKGANVRQMMDECDVNISIPPSRDESDQVTIIGTRPKVNKAIEALQQKVAEIEAENEDRQLRNFKMEVNIASSYHPKIIGRKGMVIQKIRTDHGVQIQFPPVNAADSDPDRIILTGYEHNCEAAKEAILNIVRELEDQVSVEVPIDPRVHRRLIGAKGRAIRKFMETYKVEIRFPSLNTSDPVVISGHEDNVEEAKDQLLLLEEEYMQDVREEIEEHDLVNHYLNPPSKQSNQVGFVVRDAPWDNVKRSDVKRKEPQAQSKPSTQEKPLPPDTNNIADFPCIGSSAASPRPTAWGPSRR